MSGDSTGGGNGLHRQAEDFAQRLTRIVDTTVCPGTAEFRAVLVEEAGFARVAPDIGMEVASPRGGGRSLDGADLPICLRPDAVNDALFWLRVNFRLMLDHERTHLTVSKSQMALLLTDLTRKPKYRNRPRLLLRVEYERDVTGKPASHIQVHAYNPDFTFAQARRGAARMRHLENFHIPAGGRRYRPILEDLVEFLIDEELADAHPGAKAALGEARVEWERQQLRAAVRRDPETAAAQLRTQGYEVTRPSGDTGVTVHE